VNVRSLRFSITAWYAGLLAGALLLFGVSVYLGLEHYLDSTLEATLASQSRTIASQLLTQLPGKRANWLATEIDEAFAPEINGGLIRVSRDSGEIVYFSGSPKDGVSHVSQFPPPETRAKDTVRKVNVFRDRQFLVYTMPFTSPDGVRYVVESGASYHQVQVVLHGLLLTFAIYMPFIVSIAVGGGYWLMRQSLRPVQQITDRAERITSSNLSERLPVIRTGDELERLSRSLNRMIARLDDAFGHINRFSADASHELRTPLTILRLELEGILQKHSFSPSLADEIGSALEETYRMSRIVESLLAISRLDAGEIKIDQIRLDLGDLTESTVDAMQLLAEEKCISLNCSAPAGIFVKGDRTRLQEVIVNLTDNAIQHTAKGGQVEVRVRKDSGSAVLEVADNGAGISSEALPHIFERFYRADKARSRSSGGTGLGLSIVKAICTAHGAEIKVTTEEGKGSCFRVDLPMLKQPLKPDLAVHS
jgi:heavy metal sensor kinase